MQNHLFTTGEVVISSYDLFPIHHLTLRIPRDDQSERSFDAHLNFVAHDGEFVHRSFRGDELEQGGNVPLVLLRFVHVFDSIVQRIRKG